MIEIKEKQILIDGEPRLLIGGEVHYFRLKRDEWQDRIDKLKGAGCNMVASYIPWLCHEFVEGEVDLEGRTQPELDLGAFIDLCRDNGLYFLARPGPFIMAEMKNEGLPYWVYTKHPEIIPVGWDGQPAPTRTVDYMAPGFLAEARHWYSEVMKVIVPRLHPNGGNIIAVQLDNEVGMLAWITNSPDLTDNLLDSFAEWLTEQYDEATLKRRYAVGVGSREPGAGKPAVGPIPDSRFPIPNLRSPEESYSAELMRDLGHFMRDRFARYVATLRGYAEEFGVKGVPFVINIHGTDAGRGFTFPVGISQLYESYTQDAGYIAGSDHYIGDLNMRNFQDLYLMNALMEAVNRPEQPLTSVEFEAGSGDYGGSYGGRLSPSAVDFKTRMCIAQGNRLINYYLFTGGINYPLPEPVGDGNDRISFTGEQHGTAAPVNPEGVLSYTYPRLSRSVKTMLAVGDKLARMNEERDAVAFAFIPDYYMTEYKYPESGRMNEIVENLEANRGPGAWEIPVRAMLLGTYRFSSVDVQNGPLDRKETPVLVLASARYMDGALQQKIVDYVREGGNVLLYGEVPVFDMEGKPCTLLAEALGLRGEKQHRSSRNFYLSVYADGWAAPRAEVPTHHAQSFGEHNGEALLRVVGTDEACGFDIKVGSGRVVAITAAYVCDIAFFKSVLEKLGAKAGLQHDCAHHGIFMTTSASEDGERFLHLLNLDDFEKALHVKEDGKELLEGRQLVLRGRDGLMLPLNVSVGDVHIAYSTAEIASVEGDAIEFRLTQPQDVIALETSRQVAPSVDYDVSTQDGLTIITSCKHADIDDKLTLRLR